VSYLHGHVNVTDPQQPLFHLLK